MSDRVNKQGAAKASASAADMAARPFRCEWHEGCSKSFNRKSDLQRHYRIHTNERPYACDYKPCNKTFIQRSALTVHRRTHTGDKPHKCPFLGCGKCFSDSSSLARHRRIHTNDKPYICRNQRCKKAFCRKTTMTKHIRKEHPAEPIQDDQDAEYSDAEPSDDDALDDDTEDIKEEADSPYQDSIDVKDPRLSRPLSGYHANLWRLPGQTAQGSNPLQLQRSNIPRSEASVHEIKLERTSSATPISSLTDPYSDGPMQPAGADNIPMHPTLPHSTTTITTALQYQFRGHDATYGLWSPSHDSPTSIETSSPSSASTQGHTVYIQQPYQQQSTNLPSHDQMQYSQDGMIRNIQQPMNDLAVHEIHLDQPQTHQYHDMSSTPIQQQQQQRQQQQQQQQYNGTPHHVPQQDQYISMSRDSSQHHSYAEAPPQAAIHYMGSVPPTPAPRQAISQYPTTLPEEASYYPPGFPMGSFPIGNHYSLPVGEVNQITQPSPDWLEQFKPAHLWPYQLLPNERIERWGQ